MAIYTVTIPYKFAGLNDYTLACRGNKFSGATMKKQTQKAITPYLKKLPEFKCPIRIDFVWTEANRRRDPDNCCFAKKFILDALVALGKIPNDNMTYIKGFSDAFEVGSDYKVTLTIKEDEEDEHNNTEKVRRRPKERNKSGSKRDGRPSEAIQADH